VLVAVRGFDARTQLDIQSISTRDGVGARARPGEDIMSIVTRYLARSPTIREQATMRRNVTAIGVFATAIFVLPACTSAGDVEGASEAALATKFEVERCRGQAAFKATYETVGGIVRKSASPRRSPRIGPHSRIVDPGARPEVRIEQPAFSGAIYAAAYQLGCASDDQQARPEDPSASAATAFELDAPLQTSAGVHYYSFSATVFYAQGSTLEVVAAERGGETRPTKRVAAPDQAQRRNMHAISHKQMGRAAPAAFSGAAEQELAAKRIVYWTRTHADGGHFPDASAGDDVDVLEVLIPVDQIAPQVNLHLVATSGPVQLSSLSTPTITTALLNADASAPLVLPLVRSPASLIAFGDSAIWGQGLEDAERYSTRVAKSIEDALVAAGRPRPPAGHVRVRNDFAHSGAVLGDAPLGEFSRLRDLETNMGECDQAVSGQRSWQEVPTSFTSIPCQMKRAGAWPSALTLPNDDPATVATLASPETLDALFPSGPADPGARYDYVLIQGCINDVGADRWILESGAAVRDDTRARCQHRLASRLRFVRAQFPNAEIVVVGYHNIFNGAALATLSAPLATVLRELGHLANAIGLDDLFRILMPDDRNLLASYARNAANMKNLADVALTAGVEDIRLGAPSVAAGGVGSLYMVPLHDFTTQRGAFGVDTHVFGLRFGSEEDVRRALRQFGDALQDQVRETLDLVERIGVAIGDLLEHLGRCIIGDCESFEPVRRAFDDVGHQLGVNTSELAARALRAATDAALVPEDAVAPARQAACAAQYGDRVETVVARLRCERASAFHPSPQGAKLMADAIARALSQTGRLIPPRP
jgi:lysophospholipase L1-like esterase